jgi:hypothetical protein
MMIDKDKTTTDVDESETDSGHGEPFELPEDRPKPMLFQRYYEPRFVATKVRRLKQYQMRRI